ncbi:hypothetical protein GCM10011379_38720 [Filimonas zeae]|uniref:Ig-like domain-containing protein n=1 Tax=Filimonas zeae TaxID=1737353 RepID=A0A917J112_9BACT|nr:hypothetical protein GCM10011379_38720 [Filimonas zeae]
MVNCESVQALRIKGARTQYYKGDSIALSVANIPGVYYMWGRMDGGNTMSYASSLVIHPCDKTDQGWYYMIASNPDCTTRRDSVYVAVANKLTEAPCSPANNAVSFSALPNISFTSATLGVRCCLEPYGAAWLWRPGLS